MYGALQNCRSKEDFAAYVNEGRVEVSGSGENGSEGSISVVSHGIGTAGIYTYGGSVTLQAGSVKVWGDGEENDAMETKGGGSIYAFGGSVHITSLDYLFSYERGGLESLVVNDKEWLYRTPTPIFWRATTDNDHGSGFSVKSAQWYAADKFSTCQDIELML